MDHKIAITLALLCCVDFIKTAQEVSRFKRESNSPVYDTIVVGLGASGLSAFSKLARHGKHVLGLEAADRIGGRVNTVHFGEGVVELGAEWIHGRNHSVTYELAIANNITIILQEETTKTFRSDGSAMDADIMEELVTNCNKFPGKNVEEEPLGHYFSRQCREYISKNKPELLADEHFMKDLLVFLEYLICSTDGSNNWNSSSTHFIYEPLDEYYTNSWNKYGYKTLFEIILHKYNNGPGLPANAEMKLNKKITQIKWSEDPITDVIVKCKDGSEYTAKNVIVTVSLGVLKVSHASIFSPSLPQKKVKGINNIPMGLLGKVILSFDKVWWPKDVQVFDFFWTSEDKAQILEEDAWTMQLVGATRSMGSDNVLVLWTFGEMGRYIETLPDDLVKDKAVSVLRRFMGNDVPEPTGIVKTEWFKNPLTRGSYSFDNMQVSRNPEMRQDLAEPLLDSSHNPRVMFAGEATNTNHFSTVHGAVETGIREANRLLGETKNTIS